MNKIILLLSMMVLFISAIGQNATLSGQVNTLSGETLGYANVAFEGTEVGVQTDDDGTFEIANIVPGRYLVIVSFLGFEPTSKKITLGAGESATLNFTMEEGSSTMDEIVVTGTLKEVSRLESPVPVEVYNPAFFKKNPTPNIYEALQNVNGVRPQLNCQVCNTGDIHINGLEGPYTMVLICLLYTSPSPRD